MCPKLKQTNFNTLKLNGDFDNNVRNYIQNGLLFQAAFISNKY